MEFSDQVSLEAALSDLGGLLAERNEPFEMCVIGGAAFLLREPELHHATADVDVAAQVIGQRIVAPVPTPPALERAVRDVAASRGLGPGWVSTALAAAFGVQLPEGFMARAERRTYGALVLHVASRIDLIALKLLAAVSRRDARGRRHVEDLRATRATEAELNDALPWMRSRLADPSAFQPRIDEVVAQVLAPNGPR